MTCQIPWTESIDCKEVIIIILHELALKLLNNIHFYHNMTFEYHFHHVTYLKSEKNFILNTERY